MIDGGEAYAIKSQASAKGGIGVHRGVLFPVSFELVQLEVFLCVFHRCTESWLL